MLVMIYCLPVVRPPTPPPGPPPRVVMMMVMVVMLMLNYDLLTSGLGGFVEGCHGNRIGNKKGSYALPPK